jgi:hypothetical protein
VQLLLAVRAVGVGLGVSACDAVTHCALACRECMCSGDVKALGHALEWKFAARCMRGSSTCHRVLVFVAGFQTGPQEHKAQDTSMGGT